MPESLIFDIDGTLWDSTGLVAIGYNQQLASEGFDKYFVTSDDLKRLFGRTMQEIADVLFADFPEDFRYGLMERCMKQEAVVLHNDPCQIAFPLVPETLKELAKRHRLFIVSNSQAGYPQLVMDKLGIADLIEDHLCYGDTGTCKGETILKLMEKNHVTDAVYIGDTQGDLDASLLAGIPFVYCSFGFGTPAKYDYKVSAFSDLANLF